MLFYYLVEVELDFENAWFACGNRHFEEQGRAHFIVVAMRIHMFSSWLR